MWRLIYLPTADIINVPRKCMESKKLLEQHLNSDEVVFVRVRDNKIYWLDTSFCSGWSNTIEIPKYLLEVVEVM